MITTQTPSGLSPREIRVGVASFTDPRAVSLTEEFAVYEAQAHQRLARTLQQQGWEVVDPCTWEENEFRPLRDTPGVRRAVRILRGEGVDCLILGLWKWTDPMLAVELARRVDCPVLLYCEREVQWTGMGLIAAVGAALWEIAQPECALRHSRLQGGSEEIIHWVRGAGAASVLRRKRMLLFGGSYCLRMEHLEDDFAQLKARFIGDILIDDEYLLIKRAEQILQQERSEVEGLLNWLRQGGAQIITDERMCTPEALARQAALYLAARQRLAELEAEDIGGVSVRCQPTLSEEYGITGCFLPALLPFAADHRGPQAVVPTSCEGDVKGLWTSMLLQAMAGVPALFGDIRDVEQVGRRLLVISNCGAASAYYAANSLQPEEALPQLRFCGQCQGASGAAVGYVARQEGAATMARLIRRAGQYLLQLGLGHTAPLEPEAVQSLRWGMMWPLVALELNLTVDELLQQVGSNHYSLIPGDYRRELREAAQQLGVAVQEF